MYYSPLLYFIVKFLVPQRDNDRRLKTILLHNSAMIYSGLGEFCLKAPDMDNVHKIHIILVS